MSDILSPTESIGSYGSFSSKQRSNTKAAALANLAAKRKQRNAARFKNRSRIHPEQQQPSHVTNKIDDTRQEDPVDTRHEEDPVGVVDASTATPPGSTSRINNMQRTYELEQRRIKTEKEIAGVGNEALILVYGYNPNLYEDVFGLLPDASLQDIKQSYEEQRGQLEFSMATVFTSDVPDDEINGALNESQKQAAILCGMTSAHMEQMHPRNFLEVKMDALKRAFDILGDEQSRIEYDAVLMEFQESARGELQEEVVDEEEVYAYNVARDIDYGVNGDYSYDYNETDEDDDDYEEKEVDEEEVDDDSWNQSRTSFDSHTEATDEPYHQPYEETQSPFQDQQAFQSPSQAYVKHPWKQQQQQQQHSPRDPFEFEQQQFHQPPAMPQTDNYSVASSRSTRSIHVELFDPFDLQGADQINYEHLPMVEEDNTHAHESVVEEKEGEDKTDETITVFLCPLPEGDNEDDDDDEVTVGEVIKARERGEEIDVSSLADSQREYPNMVDFVPKKEKSIKKLRSVYQSMKRSVGGGSSKGSKSTSASDSNTFRSRGVSVMSFSSKEKAQDYDQGKKRASVMSLDYSEDDDDDDDDDEVLGEHIYETDDEDEDDDDDSEVIADDLISDLTQGTPWNFQQQQQQQQVANNKEDLEIESFLNMANNFRAMDKASHKLDTNLSADEFRTLTTNDKEEYLSQFQGGRPYQESLVSMSNETHEEDEGFLDDLVGVIDEIEGIFDESLENMSRYLSCE